MNESMVEATFRDAVSTVDTLPPPLDVFRDLAAREQRRRRRRRWRGTAAGVAVLLVIAATWAGMRPSDEGATDGGPGARHHGREPGGHRLVGRRRAPPLERDGRVPAADRPIDHLAEINGGAVYGEDTGAIVFVGDDGKVTRIGTKAPGAPLVASDESGWVTWVDPRSEPPRLVVYDLTAREVLEHRTLPGGGTRQAAVKGSYPIALDLDKVYYAAEDGEHEWTVTTGRTEPVEPPGLLAVAGGLGCGRWTRRDQDGATVLQHQLRPTRSRCPDVARRDAGADAHRQRRRGRLVGQGAPLRRPVGRPAVDRPDEAGRPGRRHSRAGDRGQLPDRQPRRRQAPGSPVAVVRSAVRAAHL